MRSLPVSVSGTLIMKVMPELERIAPVQFDALHYAALAVLKKK